MVDSPWDNCAAAQSAVTPAPMAIPAATKRRRETIRLCDMVHVLVLISRRRRYGDRQLGTGYLRVTFAATNRDLALRCSLAGNRECVCSDGLLKDTADLVVENANYPARGRFRLGGTKSRLGETGQASTILHLGTIIKPDGGRVRRHRPQHPTFWGGLPTAPLAGFVRAS